MNKLIDVDNFEKRLWIEYEKIKNRYISSGIALVLGMLNGEPTFTEQELKSDGANEVLNKVFEAIDDCNSDGLTGIFCSYDDGERFKEYIKNKIESKEQKITKIE